MFHLTIRNKQRVRGAILILTAFLLVFLLGIIAFAVDLGYILLARTQLQTAADSAALAAGATMGASQKDSIDTAIKYAGLNRVGDRQVVVKSSDVIYGTWDTTTRTFTPNASGMGNAVKVTARADSSTSGAVPLFFGAVFGQHTANAQASAVATSNPRDICFVVDLSSSMNDDTDPGNTAGINSSYPGVGSQMMQKFFSDMNFGTYPGPTYKGPKVGAPLGCTTISGLASTSSSPLLYSKISSTKTKYGYTVPSQYVIYVKNDGSGKTADTTTSATTKAYSWVIDEQLGGKSGAALSGLGIMRNAQPNLDSANSSYYTYWKAYIDATPSNLGYLSYVKIFEPCGREVAPFSGTSSLLSPMSVDAPYYVHHTESTDAGNFEFPAAEMPTHSARRSLISALKVIMDRNASIKTISQRDLVSIVTYSDKTHISIVHNLDTDYFGAMNASATLQACGINTSCTATEMGLAQANSLLTTQGRVSANKVVVLLTDGKPNLYSSSNSAISSYRNTHGNSNFYGGSSSYPQDAAMMQAAMMQGKNWMFFPVAIGLQGDPDFMNRIYSIGKGMTDATGTSPYSATGNPADYETELKSIFQQIISTPKVRLVQ
jgi:Flp pilus assembly protein TadG